MVKTIAVVGAGPGVGLAVADRFGREGFKVALFGRNADKLVQSVGALAGRGIEAAAFPADVCDRPGFASALQAAVAWNGSIDVLEYGPTPPSPSVRGARNVNVENEQAYLDNTLLGAITAVRAVLPGMLQKKQGSLLFTAAVTAQHPMNHTANFGVALGALLSYVRLLNKDLAADGVHAGMLSIAALVTERDGEAPDLPGFPLNIPIPLVSPQEVADLHWDMHVKRDRVEAFAGDVEAFLTKTGFY